MISPSWRKRYAEESRSQRARMDYMLKFKKEHPHLDIWEDALGHLRIAPSWSAEAHEHRALEQ